MSNASFNLTLCGFVVSETSPHISGLYKKYIPSSKIDYYREHIVPGYNEHVKELHAIARHDFVMWRSAGKSRFREICLSMNQSRLRFNPGTPYGTYMSHVFFLHLLH